MERGGVMPGFQFFGYGVILPKKTNLCVWMMLLEGDSNCI